MPEYLVEDVQTEEQVDHFFESDLGGAVEYVLSRADFKCLPDAKVKTEHGNRSNVYITVWLPYGCKYVYEVGEVGK